MKGNDNGMKVNAHAKSRGCELLPLVCVGLPAAQAAEPGSRALPCCSAGQCSAVQIVPLAEVAFTGQEVVPSLPVAPGRAGQGDTSREERSAFLL